MKKCLRPNYVQIIREPNEEKAKVIFHAGGSQNYNEEFKRKYLFGAIEVPCGNCVACRLEYSRQWANRCYLESLCHKTTYFITLTYDDKHLVFGDKGLATLEKDALSNFMRKLRDKFGHDLNIRFFGCGEYGDQTLRPHFHLILFGCPLDDLDYNMPDMSKPLNEKGQYPIFRRKNSQGDYVYFSQAIFDCWQKGKVEVEDASWNTMAYVSRYIMKKQKGRGKEIYERLGIISPYLRMSNRPGIGYTWFLENKDKLLETDFLAVKTNQGAYSTHPHRYFEKLMMKDPESLEACLMECNKLSRIVNSKRRCIDSNTKKTLGDQSRDEEEILEQKTRVFTRDIT